MSLAPEQLALVRLMHPANSDYVEEWRHLFQGAMIRARTARGRTVTLWREGIDGLVSAGVIASGYGGSFYLTETGKHI